MINITESLKPSRSVSLFSYTQCRAHPTQTSTFMAFVSTLARSSNTTSIDNRADIAPMLDDLFNGFIGGSVENVHLSTTYGAEARVESY